MEDWSWLFIVCLGLILYIVWHIQKRDPFEGEIPSEDSEQVRKLKNELAKKRQINQRPHEIPFPNIQKTTQTIYAPKTNPEPVVDMIALLNQAKNQLKDSQKFSVLDETVTQNLSIHSEVYSKKAALRKAMLWKMIL